VATQTGGHLDTELALPTCDSGFGNPSEFFLDPIGTIGHAYQSIEVTTLVAKYLINQFYGVGPHHSYWVGCSIGGREGMVMSQSFPSFFDGILAGDAVYAFSCSQFFYRPSFNASWPANDPAPCSDPRVWAIDRCNGGSCIQTVRGRGYRFTPRVVEEDGTEPGRPVAGALIPDWANSLAEAHRRSPQSVPAVSSPADIGGRGSGNGLFYGGVIGLLCAALIDYGWQGFRADMPTRPTEPPRLSIVVLPFANASGTPKDEELAAALTDDFTLNLAQLRGSVVVARSMSQAIAARKLPLPTLGRELAVRYVLEGNIRRSPEAIELNVQLSDAASATSIWAWQFKEAASEPADLRLQVTQSLLFPLRTAFMDAEARRISSLPPATLTADDLLLKVSALNNHPPLTPPKNAESIAMLERALALDPASAEVMISLADQILRPISEFADRNNFDERLLRARTLADRARALAADSESMLELRARILSFEGRFDEALAAYSALYRSSGHFRISVAWCLIALGRSAEAVSLLEETIRLDRGMRTWYMGYLGLGVALVRIGRYEEAISWLRAANEASSGSTPQISWNLAIAYAHVGKVADARRELLEFRKRTG
jgi:TolB-like protein